MAWIGGGAFLMGTNDKESFPNERPAHLVQVNGFWMDVQDVTNAEFAKFVEATGYVTTAERPINWEDLRKQLPPGTPKPDEGVLAPGSLVFTPTSGPVPLNDLSADGEPDRSTQTRRGVLSFFPPVHPIWEGRENTMPSTALVTQLFSSLMRVYRSFPPVAP